MSGGRAVGASSREVVVRAVSVTMGTVIALTLLFGFGNVLNLAVRLGVPLYVAPLVAPAVDLSVLGLLVGTRYLVLHGASVEQLRPARRLLFASVVTLALNMAEPMCAGQFGKAAFDAVGRSPPRRPHPPPTLRPVAPAPYAGSSHDFPVGHGSSDVGKPRTAPRDGHK